MFKMSKQELVARLIASAEVGLRSLSDDDRKRQLILLTPAGMITCTEAKLSSYDEVIAKSAETRNVNIMEFALTSKGPESVNSLGDEETFLYCVDAVITPYSGGRINVPSICIALESVFGCSIGFVD